MSNYLQDKDFLNKLNYDKNKEIYINIIALSNDDLPNEEIKGRVTGGSINVDGASAVRRTCSLSFIALEDDQIVTDIYWCYNNKFKLEIGLKNNIDKQYPDIIWFNMGTYIITSFSKNKSANSLNISISGKDKMCRLNGEVSGNIMYGTDFGNIEKIISDSLTQKEKIPIKDIIRNAVKIYGQENDYNIIINDLDDFGYELWKYLGNVTLYMLINENKENIVQIIFDGNSVYCNYSGHSNIKISELEENGGQYYSFNTFDKTYNNNATEVTIGSVNYYIAKIEYGQVAGYHPIPLVYKEDELILNAGDTVTSLLDKLKSMLGEYEYFYDLNGRFIFQKKKTYTQELFSPANGEVITPTMYTSQYSYKFEDEKLFTAISNTPNINNIKNDFSIWGNKKGVNGEDIPIHVRYAIDKKPKIYVPIESKIIHIKDLDYTLKEGPGPHYYYSVSCINKYIEGDLCLPSKINEYPIEELEMDAFADCTKLTSLLIPQGVEVLQSDCFFNCRSLKKIYLPSTLTEIGVRCLKNCNNFEIIYYKGTEEQWNNIEFHNDEGKNQELIEANKKYNYNYHYYYSTDNYDWREIIYQMALDYYKHNEESDFLLNLQRLNPELIGGKTGYEQYYTDIQYYWRQIYNPLETEQDQEYAKTHGYKYYTDGDKKYWNKLIHKDPTSFTFWFDFLDTQGELSKYSIKKYEDNKFITNIGVRSKVINDTSIGSIYNTDTPKIIIINPTKDNIGNYNLGFNYTTIQIQDNLEPLFVRAAQGNSAIDKVNETINNYTSASENISLTAIPIYYLEPNTRIYIKGYGDYTLDKISYSLNYNGTMNISGNKIIRPIY